MVWCGCLQVAPHTSSCLRPSSSLACLGALNPAKPYTSPNVCVTSTHTHADPNVPCVASCFSCFTLSVYAHTDALSPSQPPMVIIGLFCVTASTSIPACAAFLLSTAADMTAASSSSVAPPRTASRKLTSFAPNKHTCARCRAGRAQHTHTADGGPSQHTGCNSALGGACLTR